MAVVAVWVAGVVVIGLLVGYLAHRSSTPAAAGSASASDDPVGRIIAIDAAHRAPAPPLSGPLLGGGHFDLASYAGHVTVVTAWGSWCEPCRAELPVLRRLAERSYPTTVDFLGIDVEDTTPAAQAMVKQAGIEYPSLVDPDRTLYSAFAPTLAGDGTPGTVIIDTSGRVAGTVIGPVSETAMQAYLRELAAERP